MKNVLLCIVTSAFVFCGVLRDDYVSAAEQEKVAQEDAIQKETVLKTPLLKAPEMPKIAVKPEPKLKVTYPLIPIEDNSDFEKAVTVTLTDENGEVTKIRLPNGSTLVRDHCFSPDGKYLYLTHQMARFCLPNTQIERGWCQTGMISIIDAVNKKYVNSVILDDVDKGAANPWGCVVTQEGKYLCVALSGTNEIIRIDLAALHTKLDKLQPNIEPEKRETGTYCAEDVKNDLAFLEKNMKLRVSLGKTPPETNSPALPRKLDLCEDGLVIVQFHFVDDFLGVDFSKDEPQIVNFMYFRDPEKYNDKVKLGEKYFNDATLSLQNWLSCASCHPEGRIDGLTWDLLNDGIGNPKKTRSLLGAKDRKTFFAEKMPDKVKTLEDVITYKLRHVMFKNKAKPEVTDAIAAYIRSLKPEPCLDQNKEKAARGKVVFNQSLVGNTRPSCASCHLGPNFTDEQKHNVGTKDPYDRSDEFFTPPLFELWRHNSFLHSGKYETLHSLFKHGEHGQKDSVNKLTDAEISDLCEYLKDIQE